MKPKERSGFYAYRCTPRPAPRSTGMRLSRWDRRPRRHNHRRHRDQLQDVMDALRAPSHPNPKSIESSALEGGPRRPNQTTTPD